MNDNIEYEYDDLGNRVSLTVLYNKYYHPLTAIDDSFTNNLDNKQILEKKYQKLYYLNDYTTNSDTYIAIKIDNNNYRYTTIGSNNNTISSNNRLLLSDYQGSIVLSLSKDNLYTINTYGYSDYGVSNIDNNPLDSKNLSISYTNQDYFFSYMSSYIIFDKMNLWYLLLVYSY